MAFTPPNSPRSKGLSPKAGELWRQSASLATLNLEILGDVFRRPGRDPDAEEVGILGPDRTRQGHRRCEDRPIIRVASLHPGARNRRVFLEPGGSSACMYSSKPSSTAMLGAGSTPLLRRMSGKWRGASSTHTSGVKKSARWVLSRMRLRTRGPNTARMRILASSTRMRLAASFISAGGAPQTQKRSPRYRPVPPATAHRAGPRRP